MISVDKAIVARLKTHGENFELLVDPDNALKYKLGEIKDVKEILASEFVFRDAGEFKKASEDTMKSIFGSSELEVVADEIIKKGEIELTTDQKRKMLEERKKQIISFIVRNSINPQTKTPNPPQRIEAAMDQAKVHVTINKSADEQIDSVVKAIREFVPLKFEVIKIAAKIPLEYSGKIHSALQGIDILKQEYTSDSMIIVFEIPAGIQDDVYGKLNGLTKGNVQTKILK